MAGEAQCRKQGEREGMSQQISVGQALGLYGTYLQGRINEMFQSAPALVNNPSLVTADPSTGRWVNLSLPQMLSEVQRGTQIGVNESVKYAAQQGYNVAG